MPDELDTGMICFQFLLIFRKAAAGELKNDGLLEVYRHIHEVDVDAEGVKGAKNFFEAKVLLQCTTVQVLVIFCSVEYFQLLPVSYIVQYF